jgi:hypothetical protein
VGERKGIVREIKLQPAICNNIDILRLDIAEIHVRLMNVTEGGNKNRDRGKA